MIENGPVPRNAQPLPHPPTGRRIEPRTAHIRIRIDDTWYHGHIQRWTRLDNDTWAVWLNYQADPEHPTIAPIWGWYAYDPKTIRPA
jgi:hypothetical protein